jgi:N-acetylglucosamine kinase-like BadF-type ATPase
MGFFLGIDGGGSKTECVLADEAGAVLARASGPGTNLHRVLPAVLRETMADCREQIGRATGLSSLPVEVTCAGFAGGGSVEARARARPLLQELFHPHRLYIVADMEIALEAAVGVRPGVVLLAGTGSIAYGRNSLGQQARAGGEGPLVGDRGSGCDIGRGAVEAVIAAATRSGAETRLVAGVREALGVSAPEDLQMRIHPERAAELARLLPVVLQAARAGDLVAQGLLAAAGDELADLAVQVLTTLRLLTAAVHVAASGGVFSASSEVLAHVRERIQRRAPGTEVMLLERTPAEGAVELAARLWWQEQNLTLRSQG